MDPAYLPTSRRDFIMNHPETYMANLHANSTHGDNIAPMWPKVTTTAYAGKALICNGYGKRLQNTAVSDDAPSYFLNPDRVTQPKNRMTQEEARVTKILKSDSSYVLPGGDSMRTALANPPADSHKRFRSFPHDSFRIKPQMYMEPLITTRPGDYSLSCTHSLSFTLTLT